MKSIARAHVWWPNINKDIEKTVTECDSCAEVSAMPSKTKLHT